MGYTIDGWPGLRARNLAIDLPPASLLSFELLTTLAYEVYALSAFSSEHPARRKGGNLMGSSRTYVFLTSNLHFNLGPVAICRLHRLHASLVGFQRAFVHMLWRNDPYPSHYGWKHSTRTVCTTRNLQLIKWDLAFPCPIKEEHLECPSMWCLGHTLKHSHFNTIEWSNYRWRVKTDQHICYPFMPYMCTVH